LLKREDVPEGALRTLQRIARGAERIANMVADLLDVTRLRAGGGLPLEPKPTDLRALCQRVVDELDALNPGRIVFVDEPGEVGGEWDPARLAQMISNLVTNALNYSPPASIVQVTVREQDERVRLEVHNEGTPIPPDVLPILFEPFRRGAEGPAASSGSPQGLGLGLFIVHEIVRAHGGTIEVTSTAAGGTTFTVALPRAAST
jgi:signal transduction histidine kinase